MLSLIPICSAVEWASSTRLLWLNYSRHHTPPLTSFDASVCHTIARPSTSFGDLSVRATLYGHDISHYMRSLLLLFYLASLTKEDHSSSFYSSRRTALSIRRDRSIICITQVVGFRNVRQPPAVYRRGLTGNTKNSVSPSLTYPYHFHTDDCWVQCAHSQESVKTHQAQHYNVCWLHRLDFKLPKPISTAEAACFPVSKF